MTVLVGFGPEVRGRGALELARLLAQSAQAPLVICCVVPERWQSVGPGRAVDHDYEQYLRSLARDALDHAANVVGDVDVPVHLDVATERSESNGLLAAAERHGARMLALGSSSNGEWGHVALGSVTTRLLHSSPLPVGLAPRGFSPAHRQRVTRVSVALDGTSACQAVLGRALALADYLGARVRPVTFAVRHGTMYPPELGLHVEDQVLAAWVAETRQVVEAALATIDESRLAGEQHQVAEGRTWSEALDEPGWEPGDLLVIGSSSGQSLVSRVFLGSTATRIIRHSPVPVVIVPHEAVRD